MNIFSFFAGAGFLDLGFEMTGHFNVVYVNEFHKAFNDIYKYARKHMGITPPRYGHHVEDISQLLDRNRLEEFKRQMEYSKNETITGIIGGPPCPDFSVAGKNRGKDGDHGKLSGIYTELICKSQPDFFLFENVKGLYRTAKHRDFFEELKNQFREYGYSLTQRLVNSLEYGVPQDRDRIILIGLHQDKIQELNLQSKDGILLNFPWDAYKQYELAFVKSLPWPDKSPYRENVPTIMPNGIIEDLTIQHWWEQNDVLNHENANMFFHPRAGITRFTTKDEGDVEKKCYKRLHRWRYSPTAAYGNNEVHIHPYLPRRITISEALAIQSLPAEFIVPRNVSLSDAFKSIGNGVPFLLARGLANTIYDYLS